MGAAPGTGSGSWRLQQETDVAELDLSQPKREAGIAMIDGILAHLVACGAQVAAAVHVRLGRAERIVQSLALILVR